MSAAFARLRRITRIPFVALAPEDTLARPALPLTLLLRPLPVAALLLLALNDHVFKGSGLLPHIVTGKLSDFAGLLFFPLLVVTLLNLVVTLVAWRLKRPLRGQSASLTQVLGACVATALFFSGVQLVEAVAQFYARAAATLSFWSDAPIAAVTMDPTDLLALPVLIGSYFFGRHAVGSVPPGRLALAQFFARAAISPNDKQRVVQDLFADVRQACPREREETLSNLIAALAADEDDATIDATLARFRAEA